jgi:hypothetical protein
MTTAKGGRKQQQKTQEDNKDDKPEWLCKGVWLACTGSRAVFQAVELRRHRGGQLEVSAPDGSWIMVSDCSPLQLVDFQVCDRLLLTQGEIRLAWCDRSQQLAFGESAMLEDAAIDVRAVGLSQCFLTIQFPTSQFDVAVASFVGAFDGTVLSGVELPRIQTASALDASEPSQNQRHIRQKEQEAIVQHSLF